MYFFLDAKFCFFFSNFPNRFFFVAVAGGFCWRAGFHLFLLSFDRFPLYLLLFFVFAFCLRFMSSLFVVVFYFVNDLFVLPLTGLFCH